MGFGTLIHYEMCTAHCFLFDETKLLHSFYIVERVQTNCHQVNISVDLVVHLYHIQQILGDIEHLNNPQDHSEISMVLLNHLVDHQDRDTVICLKLKK